MKIHRTATLAVAGLLALTTSGLAVAQTSVPVTTALGDSSRMLEVTNLAGQPLPGIALVPGRASAFRVAVRDTASTVVDPAFALQGYEVESSLTNLYATSDGGATYTYSDKIPSGEVTLGKAASALDVRDALAHLDPEYLLASSAPIDCTAINTALGNTSLAGNLLTTATSPTCALLAGLTGGALSFSGVDLAGVSYADIDLSSLATTDLPLVPTGVPDSGSKYTAPDCVATVGAGDTTGCTSGTRGTELTMLSAASASTFTNSLTTLLNGLIPAQLASIDGTGAKATLDDVLFALSNSGVPEVADFANQMVTEFSDTADQLDIINGVMEAAAALGLDDLGGFGLLASGYPTLKVDPTTATTGTYGGTLTVRLIECPACTTP